MITDEVQLGAIETRISAREGWWSAIRARVLDFCITGVLFVVSLAVYNATLTPSLSYLSPDGNELATVPYILGLAHSTGYPLYTWLGKFFTTIPIGDVAHRINLMSATLGAAGVALMYDILLLLLDRLPSAALRWQPLLRRVVAAYVALIFAFSPSFWAQTSIAEVYAPNLFMVALQTWLILGWAGAEEADPTRPRHPPTARSLAWFGAFCLVFALSTGTHFSNLGFGLGYAVFVLATSPRFAISPRALAVGIGLFTLGMLQHLWLPYKASTLTDPLMRAHAPTTLKGFYDYTLGAFPQFKFAFTWPQIPDRVVIYLHLLSQQFTLAGVLAGPVGMVIMLWIQPRRWWLLTLMYLVHVIFFTQYRVFDLDVFFIPAHFLFALFIGMGVCWIVILLISMAGRLSRAAGGAAALSLTAALALLPVWQASAHWVASDGSGDVEIDDFYNNVFETLPPNSILLGRGGVFGYDMFYWRLVYGVRPDVLMPLLPQAHVSPPDMKGRPLFSTMPANAAGNKRTPWDIPAGMIPPDAWAIPVLLGNSVAGVNGHGRQPLALYAISTTPPQLFVPQARPGNLSRTQFGGMTLVGYDLDASHARPGGRLHLILYWQAARFEPMPITTRLGQAELETHPLGLGNLDRLVQTDGPPPQGWIMVEDYWVTIPSTLEKGSWPLSVASRNGSAVLAQIAMGN